MTDGNASRSRAQRPTRTNSRKNAGLVKSKSARELGAPKKERVSEFLQGLMESSSEDEEDMKPNRGKAAEAKQEEQMIHRRPPPMLNGLLAQLNGKSGKEEDEQDKQDDLSSSKRSSSKRSSSKRSSSKRSSSKRSSSKRSSDKRSSDKREKLSDEDSASSNDRGKNRTSSARKQRWSVRANSNGNGLVDNGEICAVSLHWLSSFKSELLECGIAPDVTLGVVNGSSTEELGGQSVRVLSEKGSKCKVQAGRNSSSILVDGSEIDAKARRDWTVRDVADFVLSEDESVLEDGVEQVRADQKVCLVIHAHESLFGELVDALLVRLGNGDGKDENGKNVYVWLDTFCKRGANRDPAYVHRNISAGAFSHSVVYIDSLQNPLPLQRAWCLMEMHAAMAGTKQLECLFAPDWEVDLLRVVSRKKHYREIVALCNNIEIREAQVSIVEGTTTEESKDSIIKAMGNVKAANTRIIEALKRCVVVAVQEAVGKVFPVDAKGNLSSTDLKAEGVFRKCGLLFAELDEPDGALELFDRFIALEKNEAKRQARLLKTGLALQKQGMHPQALKFLEEALELGITLTEASSMGKSTNSSADPSKVANSLSVIASAMTAQGEFRKALEALTASLDATEALHGESDLKCAAIHHNIAVLLSLDGQQDKAAALEHCQKALDIRQNKLDSNDPKVGATLFSVGEIHRSDKRYSEALKLYEQALKVFWSEKMDKEELSGPGFEVEDLTRDEGDWQQLLTNFEGTKSAISKENEEKYKAILTVEPLRVCEKIGATFAEQGNTERALVTHSLTLAMAKTVMADTNELVQDLLKDVQRLLEGYGTEDTKAYKLVRRSRSSEAA